MSAILATAGLSFGGMWALWPVTDPLCAHHAATDFKLLERTIARELKIGDPESVTTMDGCDSGDAPIVWADLRVDQETAEQVLTAAGWAEESLKLGEPRQTVFTAVVEDRIARVGLSTDGIEATVEPRSYAQFLRGLVS